jgi:hypothetical protein
LRLVFGALQLLELLFARERRVHLRGETLAFEPVAIARGGFRYGVVFVGVEEGAFAGVETFIPRTSLSGRSSFFISS